MNRPIRRLASITLLMFFSLMAMVTYIQFVQAPSLNADSRNARTLYREYGTDRGPIIVDGESIVTSTKVDDNYKYLREYKDGPTYANVTGYFSTAFNSMTRIERAENSVLGGSDSSLVSQRLQQLISGTQPKGGAVELTLHSATQREALAQLGNQRGAVVALDPKTGAILAQVSTPSYDPNALATHDSKAAQEAWNSLNADPNKPLIDRSTGGDQYAPGSSFKMLTATAMIENLGLTPDSLVEAPQSYTPAGTNHAIWNPGRAQCGDGSGKVTLRQAFVQSCNTPFAIGGVSVGAEAMSKQAESFGFGTSFTTPLGVSASRFPELSDQASLAMASFGQHDVRVTPMQMAMIGAAIVNDGVLMEPYLVKQTLTADLETISTASPKRVGRVMSSQTSTYMRDMMVADVTSGTGYRAAIEGVGVGGKTGTAEVNADTPPHVWFVGYAPADNPTIVVAVLVENSGNAGWNGDGGSVAAPIAREVMKAYLGVR